MKSNSFIIYSLLFFSLFGAINVEGQSKINPALNFRNPFSIKTKHTGVVISPTTTASSKRVELINGSFNISLGKENFSLDQVVTSLNGILNISTDNSFEVQNSKTDNLGFTHVNLLQKYKGYVVEGGMVIVHIKDGVVKSISGKIAEITYLNTGISVNAERAFSLAKEHLGVVSALKQYPSELVIIKNSEGDSQYELTYKVRVDAVNPIIMYNVFVDAIRGSIRNKVNLIAHADVAGTGQTLYSGTQNITMDSYSGIYRLRENNRKIETYDATNATFGGSGFTGHSDFYNATTTWTGQPYLSSFTISSASNSWWYNALADPNGDFFIVIKDASNTTVYSSNYINNTNAPVTFYPNLLLSNSPYTVELWDYDAGSTNDFGGSYVIVSSPGTQSYSGNGNSGTYNISTLNNPALDVHWGMEKTYDFYSAVLGRNSYDGAGSTINNYVNGTMQLQNTQNNAFALPAPYNCMVYGLGDGSSMYPLVGLDVEGHEFTHMVINYNGNGGLTYQGESGALNESFADIFGTCVEFYSGVNPDWNIGEDVMVTNPYLRSMSNPNSAGQPDTYQGNLWVNPTDLSNDHGGVHTNSGVQNFWFYLLCQGGSGNNDLGNAYSVSGIGMSQAQQIAYRTLTVYMTPSATFYDAYLGSLNAAQDLYGNPSSQYDAVRDAWYAVGIGNNPNMYCSGQTNLTASSGTFTDGSGNANYNDNANCRWLIAPPGANTITLNFTSFDTEPGYDTVFVYDGADETGALLMTWWGNTLPPTVNSSGGALYVKFTSDINTNATGWSATYTSSGITPTCGGGQVLANPSGTFSDGSGGGNYGNNQLCYWVIAPPCANSVTLNFSSFSTELNYDGIIVYDDINATNQIAVLTGSTIPAPVTSNTGVMIVAFVSDFVVTQSGFSASYSSTGSAYCSGMTTLNSVDAGIITDGSGANNYCNNQNCSWLIQPPQATSVTLYFTAFDLEPASPDGTTIYDAVEVYDGTNSSAPLLGRFTGNTIPSAITSTSGSMFIQFYSDVDINHQGWSAEYYSTTTTYCTGSTTLTAPSGTFSDGSGTIDYGNNSDCSWLIQPPGALSINLSFSNFDTELNYDGVIVYDGIDNTAPVIGQFTGNTIPSPVSSTGGSMYVQFLSDPAIRATGWTANYNSVITSVGGKDILNNFNVYPNPSKGQLTINSTLERVVLEVTDVLGKNILNSYVLQKGENEINLKHLSSGLYLLKFISDKTTVVKKITIE